MRYAWKGKKRRVKVLSKMNFFCFLSSSDSGQEVLLDTKTIQMEIYTIKGPQSYPVLQKPAIFQEKFMRWLGNITGKQNL